MGVSRLHRVASPILAESLPSFDVVQSFDTLYMAHIDHDPLKLLRYNHTSWQFVAVSFGPTHDAPTGLAVTVNDPNQDTENNATDAWAFAPMEDIYVVTSINATTGQESRASAPVSATNDLTLKRNNNALTWTADPDAAEYRVYRAHAGGAFGLIANPTTNAFVDDRADADYTIGPPVARDPFVGDDDKPSSVTFFEQRLAWSRTRNNPNLVALSRSADFENMDVSIPLREDDAITIRLVSQGVNEAYQLVPLSKLMVFGSDVIYEIEGANGDYLTAVPPPRQRRRSGRGCAPLEPIVIDDKAFYKTRNGQQVRVAGYNFEVDGVKTDEISIFSPDLFEGFDIIWWAYAEEPLSVMWCGRNDGALLAFTWQEEQSVWGWTICHLANDGKARAGTVVREGGEDRLYLLVEREIAGVTRFTRERMASARWNGLANAMHLDCAVTRTFDPPSTIVGGLWHLEGETVAAFADGVLLEGLLVEDGQVELSSPVSKVHVGLPFDATAKTLPLDVQAAGKAQGRQQHTGKAVIRLTRSLIPEVGVDADKLRTLKVRHEDKPVLEGLFDIATDPKNRLESDVTVCIRSAPMTVTAIYLDADASGG